MAEKSLSEFIRQGWRYIDRKDFVTNWHIDAICERLEDVAHGRLRNVIINIPPRHMKLCSDETLIPTPQGYRKHGDIGPGDYVFGRRGNAIKVLSISEKGIADYEVEVTGSEIVKCNGDHLWTVFDRWSKKWRTLRTEKLARLPTEPDRSRWFLPDAEPLEFAERDLPLHPYFLGVWLGDGASTKDCSAYDRRDDGHIAKLATLGLVPKGVRQALQQLGVLGNKHIPEAYATASDAQRMELLAGLIDTDGHVEAKTGRVRISTCDKAFADQLELLVSSLGFRPYISSANAPGYEHYRPKPGHETVYQVGFQANRPIPTAIARKQIQRFDFARRRRAILSIRKSASPEVGHCLTVDSPDGLYLVGRTNVVTHNSTGACVAFPAWVWAQDDTDKPPESHLGPSTQFLYASYAQSLSVRDSIKCRRLIKSPWYQENWGDRFNFVSDQNAKTRFDTDQLGYRISTSVDGTATGEGGDIIMIDDPHNTREAESETVRNSVLAWWDETMSSRLNDPQTGAYVIIMQRVHERDLCGHILASETGWEHLCLPARFEIDHPHRWPRDPRKTDGEILWPARMPLKELDKIESRMGPYAVAGQMQQRPAPREGGMFQRAWFEGGKDARSQEHPRRIIKEAEVPEDMVEWRHWDLAATEYKVTDTRGARTAGVRIGRTKDGRYIVRHCMAFAKEGAAVMQAIYARALADGPTVSISMPQDPAQAGKQQKLVYVQKFAGFNIRFEAERGGDKVQRAEPFAAQCEAGNVWLVEGDWNKEFLDEICLFPGGARKDIADACSGAFGRLVPKLLDEGIPVGPTVYGLSDEPSRPGLSSMNPAYTGGIYGELPFHQ